MAVFCPHSPVAKGNLCVVVGTGRSGQAAAKLLHALGARVRVVDRSEEYVSAEFASAMHELGITAMYGEHDADQFADAAFVIPSPGVPVAKLRPYVPATTTVMAEVELAWHCIDTPVLAVTGTNGKSTTVALCAAMLEQAGKRVFLGGNFGTPLSEWVLQGRQADVLVLELSSFQLQTCRHFAPQVAVLTNISEDHLDYHADMQEYVSAKMRLFAHQTPGDLALLEANLAEYATTFSLAADVQLFSATDRFPQAGLHGKHNRANMEAAWLACQPFGVSQHAAEQAVAGFSPAPHTLETVIEEQGILFVNDSKATTVESMRAALESYDRPVLLLCGGNWKGGDLAGIIPQLEQHVKAVGLYGGGRDVFEQAWAGHVPMAWHERMEEAVEGVLQQACPGDVVLLSPATSSFDQYADYKARGDDFRRIATGAAARLTARNQNSGACVCPG